MSARPLLSRAAEALFWTGRYVERADNIARSIDVNLNLLLDQPPATDEQWAPLYQVTSDEPEFLKRYQKPDRESVVKFLTFDTTYANSITSCLRIARDNARTVREIISSEMWEQINGFYLMVQRASTSSKAAVDLHSFCRNVRMECHLFEGLCYATMSHSEAWHFVQMGRMMERADRTARILDVKYFILLPKVDYVGSPIDDIQWGAVLKSCSGFEMYRKRFGRLSPDKIVEFLLINREFPRSVLYCLNSVSDSLHTITGTPNAVFRFSSEQKLGQLRSELLWAEPNEIIVKGLHEYLDSLEIRLIEIGEQIAANFFNPPIDFAQQVQSQVLN
ncbi:MAG TPA: alpha-E domain-containing protein [Fimbriimonadaceae bacterium]|jgi:uncharacterized alpha-E superfamily protein